MTERDLGNDSFDAAVDELRQIIDGGLWNSWGGGPRFTNVLSMQTLNAVAAGLVAPSDHAWTRSDRQRGINALGAFFSSVRAAAESESHDYFRYDPEELNQLVGVLQELKSK